ncbi:MAG: alkaline phosphatase [Pirellulaceae bacterium]|nr:alkaline phosphatase [Planctomycetales bacterium]
MVPPPTGFTNNSRRNFLRASAITGAVLGSPGALTGQQTRTSTDNRGPARNVIFMVSDGMNHGALSAAQQYHRLISGRETEWVKLYRQRPVVRCLAETCSASSIVTDSAAASSAWGGGIRINNGSINVTPDGQQREPLHKKLQQRGWATGLVTTATITHATPAGFAANVDARGDEEVIAQQYLDRRVDVLLGGGQKFFSERMRQAYREAAYDVVTSRSELQQQVHDDRKRLLGIFSDSHIPYTIDRDNVPEIAAHVPTLSEMTKVALARLRHANNGFFLLVEGARIDHAGHANDAAASLHDQLAFDEAIGTVLSFIDAHPDTLLIITTDHGCGGIQFNGVTIDGASGVAGGTYNGTTSMFTKLQGFRRSLEWLKQNNIDGLSGAPLRDALLTHTGLALTDDQVKRSQGLKLSIANVFQEHTSVGWTSAMHTGELVEFCALGPGANLFPPFLRNYEVHQLLLRAWQLA